MLRNQVAGDRVIGNFQILFNGFSGEVHPPGNFGVFKPFVAA